MTVQSQGIDPNLEPGIQDDVPVNQQAQDWCPDGSEGCDYGGQDLPFMKALATSPGLLAVFSGHDHGSSFCGRWDGKLPEVKPANSEGIFLCFGQRSGFNGYGKWIRGSRQLVISLDDVRKGELDTHIRLETGAVIGAVRLNSTYGVSDYYPATPNAKSGAPGDV